jgi:phage FluMu gp28-like protein
VKRNNHNAKAGGIESAKSGAENAASPATNLNAKTAKTAKAQASGRGPRGATDPTDAHAKQKLGDPTAKAELPAHLDTSSEQKPLINFRPYQWEPFANRTNGIEVWCWSRQIGKSYTLAAWAVDRLLTRPGRLVTTLSNSKANGQELNMKVAEVCEKLGLALKGERPARSDGPYLGEYEQYDFSEDVTYESMSLETHITVGGRKGRIKVLAASPRTARGFSGDLILDEFAFHENSQAIWEAAEPIISSNPDFLCRIASTPNGKHNMFYRLCNDPSVVLRKVPRSEAFKQGLKIYHPKTRQPITPDEARALAQDKRAYDQNYECQFADENMALLTYELIARAETEGVGVICQGEWSAAAIAKLRAIIGPVFVGVDVGRNRDLTVITVLEKVENVFKMRAMLELENMRLPDQKRRLKIVAEHPHFRKGKVDMTGLGVGLLEFAQDDFGRTRWEGVNFSTTVPVTARLVAEGRKQETAKVTEVMATEMLGEFEDNRVRIIADVDLREDLRKPERIVTATGRVSIAATRDEAGHADRFWSLALALYAARGGNTAFVYGAVKGPERGSPEIKGRMVERGGGCV